MGREEEAVVESHEEDDDEDDDKTEAAAEAVVASGGHASYGGGGQEDQRAQRAQKGHDRGMGKGRGHVHDGAHCDDAFDSYICFFPAASFLTVAESQISWMVCLAPYKPSVTWAEDVAAAALPPHRH